MPFWCKWSGCGSVKCNARVREKSKALCDRCPDNPDREIKETVKRRQKGGYVFE